MLLAIQSLHEPRRSLLFDVHTLCVGGERLAGVHHYIYIYITFTFHLHAQLVVEKMCVTIFCRGITSRRLAALMTSLCQSKEVGITCLVWYVSLCATRLVGESLACRVRLSLPFSLRFTNFLVEMLWYTAWDNFYLHIYMDTYIYIHTCIYIYIYICRSICFTNNDM